MQGSIPFFILHNGVEMFLQQAFNTLLMTIACCIVQTGPACTQDVKRLKVWSLTRPCRKEAWLTLPIHRMRKRWLFVNRGKQLVHHAELCRSHCRRCDVHRRDYARFWRSLWQVIRTTLQPLLFDCGYIGSQLTTTPHLLLDMSMLRGFERFFHQGKLGEIVVH